MSKYEKGDKVRYINAAKAMREGEPRRHGKEMTIQQVLHFGRYVAGYFSGGLLNTSLFASPALIIIRGRDVELIESAGDRFMQELVDEKKKEQDPLKYQSMANGDVKTQPDCGSSVQSPSPVQTSMDPVVSIAEPKKGERKKPVFNLKCKQCGMEFTAAGPRTMYCPECTKKRFSRGGGAVKINRRTPPPLLEPGDPSEYAENQIAKTIAEHDARLLKNKGGSTGA